MKRGPSRDGVITAAVLVVGDRCSVTCIKPPFVHEDVCWVWGIRKSLLQCLAVCAFIVMTTVA